MKQVLDEVREPTGREPDIDARETRSKVAMLVQVAVLRSMAEHGVLRAAVCLGLTALTIMALVDLSDDVRTLL